MFERCHSRRCVIAGACFLIALLIVGCASEPKDDDPFVKTFACKLAGERLVIRFEVDEARMLMPSGVRQALYQVPTASGVRYLNGAMELRGKGTQLELIQNGVMTPVTDCEPYKTPK